MKAFVSLFLLFSCLASLSAEAECGVCGYAMRDFEASGSGFVHAGVFQSTIESSPVDLEDDSLTLEMDVNISFDGSSLTLIWTPVIGAVSYKVYSSESPEVGFSEDTSGNYADTSWTTTLTGTRRFYYVTAHCPENPTEMVFVPGGTFTMGDTIDDSLGDLDEIPPHIVTLSPFFIGRYEVTQSDWVVVMGSNPATGYGEGDNYPVYNVSWYASVKFCNARSILEGLTPVYSIAGSTNPADWGPTPTVNNAIWNAAICNWNASGYRLPTEAEWEYAARSATNSPDYLYSGSNDFNDVAWCNSTGGTQPVGTKLPNSLGIYDMSGNVWEWCWDWYSDTYYESCPQNDPTGPYNEPYRIRRGGRWSGPAYVCRISNRDYQRPTAAGNIFGFRICRSGL